MRTAFFSAALLLSGATFAATPINGWYSSVFGGYTYLQDNISVSRFGITRTDAKYDGGYNAGGRIGFQSYPLRYEAEFTYTTADFSSFYLNNVKKRRVGGQTTAALGMANVYYDFPDMVPGIQPFLGVGIGYAWVEGTLKSRGPIYGATYYKGSDNVFAYQGTAGLTYNFAENYAINLAYRYIGTDKVHNLGKVFQANLATVGVIYRFDEVSYK